MINPLDYQVTGNAGETLKTLLGCNQEIPGCGKPQEREPGSSTKILVKLKRQDGELHIKRHFN